MNDKGYKYIEHPSDIAIQCWGNTLNELLENAAKAIYDYIIDETSKGIKIKKRLNIEANNIEELFSHWISDIIFFSHAHRIFLNRFDYEVLNEKKLIVNAYGMKINKSNKFKSEVKAMTYHNFSIKKNNDGWEAYFIVDV